MTNNNGQQEDISGVPSMEQAACPLVNMPCHDYNVPDRKCDWFVPLMLPHPSIAGQTTQVMACKIDVIIKLLAHSNAMAAQTLATIQSRR